MNCLSRVYSYLSQSPVQLTSVCLLLMFQGVQLPFSEVETESSPANLGVFVAVGPFSTSDNLEYEPLKDLIKYLQRDRPDVCILVCWRFQWCTL